MEKKADFRRIFGVFIALAVLTLAEYIVALNAWSNTILILIAVAKAGLIIQYFMHIYRLWRTEAH